MRELVHERNALQFSPRSARSWRFCRIVRFRWNVRRKTRFATGGQRPRT